jgi:hypothetical protein
MAYFEEGSEAMVALEAMVDTVGLPNVLYALAHIERAKAAELQHETQDRFAIGVQWHHARADALGCAAEWHAANIGTR